MDLGLKGRVALVAGASRGLGKAIALELAREGALVAICARSAEQLEAAAEEIRRATGARVEALPADVSDAQEVERLIVQVLERFGRLDILVNNAGGPPAGSFSHLSDQDWLRALETNLLSAVRLSRAAAPSMQANRWGRIINLTSVSARQPMDDLVLSNVARAGVLGLAKSLSNELAAYGITVNSVCPGYNHTSRLVEVAQSRARREGRSVEDILAGYERQVPLGRLGEPEEVAALVAFLASERAGYITGTAIQVDGGYVRGLF